MFDEALIDRDEWSIFRYRKFIPLRDESWREVTMGEGMTPIARFDEDLLLKMDYFMPTLSFKDRGAAVLVSHCRSMRGKEILELIYKHDIEIVKIPEEAILPARAALAAKGIYCEHTTAGNYAAFLRYKELYGDASDSLITMCGAGLKSDH